MKDTFTGTDDVGKNIPGREPGKQRPKRMKLHGTFPNDKWFRLARGEEAGEVSKGHILQDFVSLLRHEAFIHLEGKGGPWKGFKKGKVIIRLVF